MQVKNFGEFSLQEIENVLSNFGLSLGMDTQGWTAPGINTTKARAALQLHNLNLRVDEVTLSVRAANCLQNANIQYLGELVRMSEEIFEKHSAFGPKSRKEIKDMLAQFGLSFGMNVGDWIPS
ncbi:MAG: hypothetical protein HQM15_07880 [Deltaproteobacteria bacterium]|nr:hypothetical protein [Deltaproteobacteria bacterium]